MSPKLEAELEAVAFLGALNAIVGPILEAILDVSRETEGA